MQKILAVNGKDAHFIRLLSLFIIIMFIIVGIVIIID